MAKKQTRALKITLKFILIHVTKPSLKNSIKVHSNLHNNDQLEKNFHSVNGYFSYVQDRPGNYKTIRDYFASEGSKYYGFLTQDYRMPRCCSKFKQRYKIYWKSFRAELSTEF